MREIGLVCKMKKGTGEPKREAMSQVIWGMAAYADQAPRGRSHSDTEGAEYADSRVVDPLNVA